MLSFHWILQKLQHYPVKIGNTDDACRRLRLTYGFVAWQRQQLLKALDHVDEMETEGFVEENVQDHVGWGINHKKQMAEKKEYDIL